MKRQIPRLTGMFVRCVERLNTELSKDKFKRMPKKRRLEKLWLLYLKDPKLLEREQVKIIIELFKVLLDLDVISVKNKVRRSGS